MRHMFIGVALASLVSVTSPCFAASPETEAFLANIRLDSAFIVDAGKLVADRSESGALQSFATREMDVQGSVLAAIEQRTSPEVAQDLPMTVASNDLVTGRSAAVAPATDADAYSAPAGTGSLMPAALISLDHLASAKGEAFDTLYKATQVNALRQMAAVYNAYSMTGDDAGLRQMAKTELAATNRAIAEIARF